MLAESINYCENVVYYEKDELSALSEASSDRNRNVRAV